MRIRWGKVRFTGGLIVLVSFIVFLVDASCNVLFAEAEGTVVDVAPQTESMNVAESVEIEVENLVDTDNITVDFKDADINDVLKIMSYKSGVNIVAGNDVEGTVTIRLVDVPWERALGVILKNAGFVFERDDDIIRVTTVEILSTEELATEIFILNYADGEQVSEAIKAMLSTRGSVKFDVRTNQLVVTDVPTNVYKIGKIIEKLDQKTAQVLIEAKIIETTLSDDERLGIDWTLGVSAIGAVRPLSFPWATDKTYGKTGQEYFPKIDPSEDAFADSFPNNFPYAPYANQTTGGDFRFGTLNFSQLQFVLELLKSRSDTRTLSNPSIMTLDNQTASIVVGEEYPIPVYERNDSTGGMQVIDYKIKEVGIVLYVTPQINAAEEIVVHLKPEISAFLRNQVYGDIVVPVFSVRKAETKIMIKDGETIVIGELISDRVVDVVRKVPFLGDIPLIGYAFRKTEKDIDKTDLMIFITVKLITTEGKLVAR